MLDFDESLSHCRLILLLTFHLLCNRTFSHFSFLFLTSDVRTKFVGISQMFSEDGKQYDAMWRCAEYLTKVCENFLKFPKSSKNELLVFFTQFIFANHFLGRKEGRPQRKEPVQHEAPSAQPPASGAWARARDALNTPEYKAVPRVRPPLKKILDRMGTQPFSFYLVVLVWKRTRSSSEFLRKQPYSTLHQNRFSTDKRKDSLVRHSGQREAATGAQEVSRTPGEVQWLYRGFRFLGRFLEYIVYPSKAYFNASVSMFFIFRDSWRHAISYLSGGDLNHWENTSSGNFPDE